MKITTDRFGTLELPCDQMFLFPGGLIGLERRRQWALIPDTDHSAMAWLQSTTQGNLALPMVSPRAFYPDYRARLADRDLKNLRLRPGDETFILTTVSVHQAGMTANLRAPVVLNLRNRLGGQLVTTDEQPVRAALPGMSTSSQRTDLSAKRAA